MCASESAHSRKPVVACAGLSFVDSAVPGKSTSYRKQKDRDRSRGSSGEPTAPWGSGVGPATGVRAAEVAERAPCCAPAGGRQRSRVVGMRSRGSGAGRLRPAPATSTSMSRGCGSSAGVGTGAHTFLPGAGGWAAVVPPTRLTFAFVCSRPQRRQEEGYYSRLEAERRRQHDEVDRRLLAPEEPGLSRPPLPRGYEPAPPPPPQRTASYLQTQALSPDSLYTATFVAYNEEEEEEEEDGEPAGQDECSACGPPCPASDGVFLRSSLATLGHCPRHCPQSRPPPRQRQRAGLPPSPGSGPPARCRRGGPAGRRHPALGLVAGPAGGPPQPCPLAPCSRALSAVLQAPPPSTHPWPWSSFSALHAVLTLLEHAPFSHSGVSG